MDDTQQAQIFNTLHTLANEITARIQNDLNAKLDDLQGVREELNRTLDQLHEKDKQIAELLKRNAELSASNMKLTAALQTSQDNLSRARREVDNLRTCLTQIQRFLAG